jgi:hypothetical protein
MGGLMMEKLTKFQAVEIAVMLSDLCKDTDDCNKCPFHTKKGCMLSDKNNEYMPSDWIVRQIDLFK